MLHKPLSIVFFALFSTTVFAKSASLNDAASVRQELKKIALPFLTEQGIPGAAIAVYYNGQEYFYNYGLANKKNNQPVTKDTIFELASITKIFTTTLLSI